jgi:hypothetical protein
MQRRNAGAVILQRVEGWLALFVQCDDFAVSSGILESALAMPEYLIVKSLSLRERSWTLPFDLMARARYPSNFISYCQSAPSGSFSVRRSNIGSMNAAFLLSGINAHKDTVVASAPALAQQRELSGPYNFESAVMSEVEKVLIPGDQVIHFAFKCIFDNSVIIWIGLDHTKPPVKS